MHRSSHEKKRQEEMMLRVRFWGTRGSIPVSGERYLEHGGATTCLEVVDEATEGRIIIDCGSGMAALGRELSAVAVDALVLQTHFHWDHMQGFPFFSPVYRPDTRLEMWAARHDDTGFEEVLDTQMTQPSFPVGLDALPCALSFRELPQEGSATYRNLAHLVARPRPPVVEHRLPPRPRRWLARLHRRRRDSTGVPRAPRRVRRRGRRARDGRAVHQRRVPQQARLRPLDS
ncbi:hypothetical protein FIV42_12705 [Persicimonas caeni]|uniref:MBL fold metallo-hydrolase n=1 Tax=Persicimonas caeni TaxID=2292766 RepID=A0A4Y6PUZ8_PERCE|nr:hypothetical protein FIV42_12705 [Persicimonas caeni]QED32796.1 hypothetical protein FRD00_12700 [Persicimonas caeni]